MNKLNNILDNLSSYLEIEKKEQLSESDLSTPSPIIDKASELLSKIRQDLEEINASSLTLREIAKLREVRQLILENSPSHYTSLISKIDDIFHERAGTSLRKLIQKRERRRIQNEIRRFVQQPSVIRDARALEVNNRLKQNPGSLSLSRYIREPLVNLQKEPKVSSSERRITKLVSYERFVGVLRNAFIDTLTSILQSPSGEQAYLIIADQQDKSTNWVASHLLDMMSIHPPQAVIKREELSEYLSKHPEIKHIVMVDDGAYSGYQSSDYIKEIKLKHTNYHFHFCIPFMTRLAKERIEAALAQSSYEGVFPERQLMLNYQELEKLKFYTLEENSVSTLHVVKKSTTPTWMAHKSPTTDICSSDAHMLKVTGDERPIEPYKEKNYLEREKLITRYKRDDLSPFDEEIKELISFVQTNRGDFFIANSYTCSYPAYKDRVFLLIGEEKIRFGGRGGIGLYQFKLDDVFI